ncbi:hypothetical protein ABE493_16565 [Stenotrophomonas terrae]|uniref:hypothetical protein n=1 Tax=Stenotrophomonas terrae TaxID=405446 RepID=UPI003207917D
MFDITGHADQDRIVGPKGDMNPGETIELARAAGLKEGETFFVGACNVGAGSGAYAQSLADINNSWVIAATGFAMFPTTQPRNGGLCARESSDYYV